MIDAAPIQFSSPKLSQVESSPQIWNLLSNSFISNAISQMTIDDQQERRENPGYTVGTVQLNSFTVALPKGFALTEIEKAR